LNLKRRTGLKFGYFFGQVNEPLEAHVCDLGGGCGQLFFYPENIQKCEQIILSAHLHFFTKKWFNPPTKKF
jgi:hypothetical protein